MHIPITNMELEITISPQVFESIEVVALVLSDLVVRVVVKAIRVHGEAEWTVINKQNWEL